MALQNNDLLLVGRGQTSYNVTYNEVKQSIEADSLAAVEAEKVRAQNAESALASDIATEKARAEQAESDLSDGIATEKARAEAVESGLSDDIAQEVADRVAGDLAEKTRAEAVESGLSADITQEEADRIAGDLAEKTRAEAAEQDIRNDLTQEAIDRAAGDAANAKALEDLTLDAISDVTVTGATNNQVLYYNESSGEWQAKEIVLSSNLNFSGDIDVTTTAPPSGDVAAGSLFVNTGTGDVDASFGTELQAALSNGAVGGEFIAYNGTVWSFVGAIGGGLGYDSFTVDNVTETEGSKGELSYNSSNGTFSFTKVDLGSRVPMDLSTLTALPV